MMTTTMSERFISFALGFIHAQVSKTAAPGTMMTTTTMNSKSDPSGERASYFCASVVAEPILRAKVG